VCQESAVALAATDQLPDYGEESNQSHPSVPETCVAKVLRCLTAPTSKLGFITTNNSSGHCLLVIPNCDVELRDTYSERIYLELRFAVC
jgi:hypothetical protein